MEWTHLWISKETSSHLYGLRQLKRSRVAPKELILFCSICILSLLEYACQFFHVHYQPTWTTIWNIYKGAFFGLLTPTLSYAEALRVSGLPTLFKRRAEIILKLFIEIFTNKEHKLHSLLPEVNIFTYSLRNQRLYKRSRCRTECCKILSHVLNN